MKAYGKEKGFGLIEVLVSVVIVAIGLLGIAAMQAHSVRYNHSAQLRSTAITQASNMIDRMSANQQGVQEGQYNSISGTPSDPGCSTCSTAQIAQKDAHEWNTNNATLMPSGQGTVAAAGGSRYTITIRWDGNRTGATGTGCSGNTDIDLSCLIVEVQL